MKSGHEFRSVIYGVLTVHVELGTVWCLTHTVCGCALEGASVLHTHRCDVDMADDISVRWDVLTNNKPDKTKLHIKLTTFTRTNIFTEIVTGRILPLILRKSETVQSPLDVWSWISGGHTLQWNRWPRLYRLSYETVRYLRWSIWKHFIVFNTVFVRFWTASKHKYVSSSST